MAAQTSPTMIGRDAELTHIAAALGVRTSHGPGAGGAPDPTGIVLVSGDAGVGKTRLLIELRDLAQTAGWQVVAGHCLDFGDSALPYLPFSEVLGRLAAELPDVVDRVAEARPALARLQPGQRVRSAADGADGAEGHAADRTDLFESLHSLLEAVAEKVPVLLVIEDLHWADQSTRDLLGFLFSRPFTGPVALVASYRSDDLHRRHPLRRQVAEWSRMRGVDRLQLPPLPEADVRTLIGELAPGGLGERTLTGIVARAEGNAFFVEELVASGTDSVLPDDLADLLLVRLDQLEPTAREVVRIASVAGRKVTHDLLAAASGLDQHAIDDGIRQAVEMNVLVSSTGSYAFRHALLGEAVYDDLLPGERVRLHAQYARALAQGVAQGTAAELARHARRAHDLDTALTASIEAGNEAMLVGGPGEAARHYEQALELLADPQRSAAVDVDVSKLVVSAADALSASGDNQRAVALVREQLDRLPEGVPGSWRPRLLSAYARELTMTETDLDPIEISAEAVALAPERDSGLRADVLATHARILAAWGRYEPAQRVGMEALTLAERLDLPLLASDIVTTLSGLKKAGPKDALRLALTEAVEQAARAGALPAELRGRYLLGRSYEDAAEWEGAASWFGSALDRGVAASLPWAPYCLESRWQLAWICFVVGSWDRALELTALADDESGPALPRAMLESVRVVVESARGVDVSDRVTALRHTWEREGAVAIHSAGVEIEVAGRAGDVAGALSAYDDVVSVLSRIWHEWFGARVRLATVTIAAVARALPRVSATDRPALLARVDELHTDGTQVLAQYSDPSGFWGAEGRAWYKRLDAETLRARWLAGIDAPPRDVLLDAWHEAALLFDELGHVPELAQVQTTYAGILRAAGDVGGSRELGDAARETAHRLGARPLLDQLTASGSAPVRGEAGGQTLTAREDEILALVAEGRSNGEIAKVLFISAKTVSVHVSNILGKLGASGRTEAAAIARRRGLLD